MQEIKASVTVTTTTTQRCTLPVIDPTRADDEDEYADELLNKLVDMKAHEDTEVACFAEHLPLYADARKPSGATLYKRVDTARLYRQLNVTDVRVLCVNADGSIQLWKPDDVVVTTLGTLVSESFLHDLAYAVCPK